MYLCRFYLYCLYRSDDLYILLSSGEHLAARKIKGGILFIASRKLQQPSFCHAVNNPSDISPVNRSRTHRTGLRSGI